MQGEMIADYLLKNYDAVDLNGDGTISYVMFKGQNGNAEAEFRTKYAVEDANAALKKAGKPELMFYDKNNRDKYLVDKNGTWAASASNEYMTTILTEYTGANKNMVAAIICNNDGMAEGVVASLQERGYNLPGAHLVPVFGVDATDSAKALIADGAMTGTVKQDNVGMAAAIRATVEAILGGKAPVDALASLNDERFTIAPDSAAKLFVAYAPYTG
jgi:methyl-galactoside transport system substrate-binding protein